MSNDNTIFPHRKSPRASFIDYNNGDYFVTVCTKDKIHYFGEIINGVMYFNQIGEELDHELRNVSEHHPHVTIPIYTVMPNHFHAIIRIAYPEDVFNANRCIPTAKERMLNKVGNNHDTSNPFLSTFIGQIKASITRYANKCNINFKWQPRYHDHLVRGITDGNQIAQYIKNNVANWTLDCFYT